MMADSCVYWDIALYVLEVEQIVNLRRLMGIVHFYEVNQKTNIMLITSYFRNSCLLKFFNAVENVLNKVKKALTRFNT